MLIGVAAKQEVARFVLTVDSIKVIAVDERRGRGPSPGHLLDEDVLGDAVGLFRRRIVLHCTEQRRTQSVDVGAVVGGHM